MIKLFVTKKSPRSYFYIVNPKFEYFKNKSYKNCSSNLKQIVEFVSQILKLSYSNIRFQYVQWNSGNLFWKIIVYDTS